MEIVFAAVAVASSIKPMINFCGGVPWWIWCRAPNKVTNPLKPVKKVVKKVLKP